MERGAKWVGLTRAFRPAVPAKVNGQRAESGFDQRPRLRLPTL